MALKMVDRLLGGTTSNTNPHSAPPAYLPEHYQRHRAILLGIDHRDLPAKQTEKLKESLHERYSRSWCPRQPDRSIVIPVALIRRDSRIFPLMDSDPVSIRIIDHDNEAHWSLERTEFKLHPMAFEMVDGFLKVIDL